MQNSPNIMDDQINANNTNNEFGAKRIVQLGFQNNNNFNNSNLKIKIRSVSRNKNDSRNKLLDDLSANGVFNDFKAEDILKNN